MNKFILKTLLMVLLLSALSGNDVFAAGFRYVDKKLDNLGKVPSISGITPEMEKPDFWINKLQLPNEIILSTDEIKKMNMEICKKFTDNVDMFEKPLVIQGSVIKKWITAYVPQKNVYGSAAQDNTQEFLLNRDLDAIQNEVIPRLGFTLRQSELRSFPVDEKCFTEEEKLIDRYQESRLDPGEPIIILHISKDKKWYFVQTNNYRAWILANNVVFAKDSISWTDMVQTNKFIIVTSSTLCIEKKDGANSETLIYEMGAKIPLLETTKKDYIIQIPIRDKKNQLVWQKVKLPKTAPVNVGYLPFTRANVIKLAFEFYGQKYGWGGMYNSVDCSSFIMNIYRTMGLMIPRNSSEQSEMDCPKVDFSGDTQSRLKSMSKLLPGDQIFSKGHVMLYLGEDNGDYYVIHSFMTAGDVNKPLGDSTYETIMANCVMVTPVKLINTEGTLFLDKFINANLIGSR